MIIALNKKAGHDYEFLEKLDGGVVLTGAETKSAKSGGLNLRGAFVTFRNEEAYLTGAQIAAYKHAKADPNYDPTRFRKLLFHAQEIARLIGKKQEKGLTLVPVMAYTTPRGRIKVTIAVARGKREYEKRAVIKKRETEREMKSAMRFKKR